MGDRLAPELNYSVAEFAVFAHQDAKWGALPATRSGTADDDED